MRRPLGTALMLLALAVGVSACGASSRVTHAVAQRHLAHGRTVSRTSLGGLLLRHPQPEPPLELRDSLGHRVDLAADHGKAVLVTFIYTHCPDTCPLIVADLHNMLALLGPRAGDVRIIAVSTDPRGDTRPAVRQFLAKHAMTGRMEYLIGSHAQLTPVWRAWGISASAPTANDRVGHSALIYGISASGKVLTVYPANFKPAMVAHDVPILASL